jgi:SanA protein
MHRYLRHYRRWLLGIVVLMLVSVVMSQWIVRRAGSGKLYATAAELPERRVLLVLGCSPLMNNAWTNWFFTYRIRAAAEAWKAGKARAIIVSGDNSTENYDEPTEMKAALVAQGVPEEVIYCDYAGFRTLDSVVRAGSIFGQKKITVVSQRFHNERALFLAQSHGLDAIALNAEDVPVRNAVMTEMREVLARVAAVLDCWVLGTGPKFLGPAVAIPTTE